MNVESYSISNNIPLTTFKNSLNSNNAGFPQVCDALLRFSWHLLFYAACCSCKVVKMSLQINKNIFVPRLCQIVLDGWFKCDFLLCFSERSGFQLHHTFGAFNAVRKQTRSHCTSSPAAPPNTHIVNTA